MTTVPLGGSKAQAAVLAFDGSLPAVYVAESSGTLSVVDAARNAVAKTVSTDPNIRSVGADDQFVYAVAAGAHQIQVLRKDGWSSSAALFSPESLAGTLWVDQAHHVVYAPTQHGSVVAFNAQPGAVPALRFEAGSDLGPITGGPDTVYVAGGRSLTSIDVASGQTRSAPLTDGPVTGLVYDGRTGLVWAVTGDHHLLAIDGTSLQVERSLAAASAASLVFDPGLRFMYAIGEGGFGSYDTNTMRQWAQVSTGDQATETGAVNATNHELYLYEPGSDQLTVYAWGVSGSGPVTGGGGGGTAPLGTAANASSGSGAGATAGNATASSRSSASPSPAGTTGATASTPTVGSTSGAASVGNSAPGGAVSFASASPSAAGSGSASGGNAAASGFGATSNPGGSPGTGSSNAGGAPSTSGTSSSAFGSTAPPSNSGASGNSASFGSASALAGTPGTGTGSGPSGAGSVGAAADAAAGTSSSGR